MSDLPPQCSMRRSMAQRPSRVPNIPLGAAAQVHVLLALVHTSLYTISGCDCTHADWQQLSPDWRVSDAGSSQAHLCTRAMRENACLSLCDPRRQRRREREVLGLEASLGQIQEQNAALQARVIALTMAMKGSNLLKQHQQQLSMQQTLFMQQQAPCVQQQQAVCAQQLQQQAPCVQQQQLFKQQPVSMQPCTLAAGQAPLAQHQRPHLAMQQAPPAAGAPHAVACPAQSLSAGGHERGAASNASTWSLVHGVPPRASAPEALHAFVEAHELHGVLMSGEGSWLRGAGSCRRWLWLQHALTCWPRMRTRDLPLPLQALRLRMWPPFPCAVMRASIYSRLDRGNWTEAHVTIVCLPHSAIRTCSIVCLLHDHTNRSFVAQATQSTPSCHPSCVTWCAPTPTAAPPPLTSPRRRRLHPHHVRQGPSTAAAPQTNSYGCRCARPWLPFLYGMVQHGTMRVRARVLLVQ